MGTGDRVIPAMSADRSEIMWKVLPESIMRENCAPKGPMGLDPQLLEELTRITEKISVGITIHTEAVMSARALRTRPLFRIFRLAGHAPLPMRYSFEDDIL